MVVKSLKYLAILFSCIISHDLLITWHGYANIWHQIPDTWYLTLDTWYAITWYVTLYTWHAITWYWYTWPDVVTPDWILLHLTLVLYCLFMIIAFTGTWHDYYTATRHLVLLYSWTPETGRLMILYSWYYTPIDPRNWLIMDIGLLWTHCGHCHCTIYNKVLNLHRDGGNDGYRYSFRVYGGHTNVVQLILEIIPGGHQVFPWDVPAPLLS